MENTTRAAIRLLPLALRRAIIRTAAATSALAAFNTVALAQRYHGGAQHSAGAQAGGPTLHVNPRWKECSFQLDASLTQAAWRQFTGEAGVVTCFRPLSGAEPMGKGRFEVSVLQWETAIDDSEAAWNDTFVHPDSTHLGAHLGGDHRGGIRGVEGEFVLDEDRLRDPPMTPVLLTQARHRPASAGVVTRTAPCGVCSKGTQSGRHTCEESSLFCSAFSSFRPRQPRPRSLIG